MSRPQQALRRRRLIQAAAAAVPAVVAVACSGAGTPPSGSAIGPAQIALVHWGQGFAAELRQRQVDAFMAAYPQIKVEHQPTPGGAAYFDKLQARYAAGSAPDMFFFEPKDLLGYVARRL